MGIIAFDIGGSAVKYGVYEADELQAKGKFTTPTDWETMLTQLEGGLYTDAGRFYSDPSGF